MSIGERKILIYFYLSYSNHVIASRFTVPNLNLFTPHLLFHVTSHLTTLFTAQFIDFRRDNNLKMFNGCIITLS